MSDPENTDPTPAENWASRAEKELAEGRKADAEARKLDAEAAVAAAEARKADAQARAAVLDTEDKERKNRDREASDAFNHVYRFHHQVDRSTVAEALERLTQWHRQSPDCEIEVIFNSPGGDVIEGFVLFDHLRWLSSKGHKITTGCTGMAASMGGILMQAGDYRWTSGQAWYMIHRAAFGAIGKTFDVEDKVEWIKRIEARIIDIFVTRSHLSAAKIKRNWDRKDWWITADEALEFGLVDEIRA